ncbi:hypothetical protein ASG32_03000 [Methylobacterium sp. Leaf361]|uniref:hypothetical protein n=1 Tax=Methylobacterium sp. Leaf361 TaxID=1736352 RepID=UPI000701E14A|nr:hypothetical protein [Methylobacterium sp. Leaf361]KQS81733.1 hypothetical protein ASG32_03000 [Methylobacterium sp. Leaf361]
MASENLSRQVADQCRVVAHLATAIAKVHSDYAALIEAGAMSDLHERIGRRTASLMERLGDALNGMDATSADDDWTYPVFREAQRLFPTSEA